MNDPGKRTSIVLTKSPSRAAARSRLRGVGFPKDNLHHPARNARLAITLLFASLSPIVSASAQAPDPPLAPLPSILSTATKVFLANAGDQENADCLRAYNVFYADLDALHRYTLVSDPSQADLVVELHYEIDLGAAIVGDQGRKNTRQFRAALFDAKSHTLVWSLTERTNYAVFQKTATKTSTEPCRRSSTISKHWSPPSPPRPTTSPAYITKHAPERTTSIKAPH